MKWFEEICKVLLIRDGYSSYCENIRLLEVAKANELILVVYLTTRYATVESFRPLKVYFA